ncbi:hypothetical protein H4S04_000853 [Coemansia sp. S16]|nr:hypothetical protein H4S04_000853 [Coemansia sp. S16]
MSDNGSPSYGSAHDELPLALGEPGKIFGPQQSEGSYVSNLPLPVFEDAMPFPILRRLKIPFMYPVGNDIFFRGNAATLEYLSIKLNRDIVVMLREHSVFTPRSHSSLRRVNVEYDDSSEPGELASNAEALQFVLSIGTRASVRVTNIPATGADLIRATTSLHSYASIQVLSLCLTTLDLWEVINLIMLLPFLSDLSTKPPVARALPSGVTLDDLPAFMVLTFAPMGRRFNCWRLSHTNATRVGRDSSKCVLLVALACPNFWCVISDFARTNQLVDTFEDIIALETFKPYASRYKYFQLRGAG